MAVFCSRCLLLYLFSILILLASSASADCGNSSTTAAATTINNAADATALAKACPTFFGNIVLAQNSIGDINFDGLVSVNGQIYPSAEASDFTTQITGFHSSSLTSLSGDLGLFSSAVIEEISFSALRSMDGRIIIGELPLLKSIDLSSIESIGQWFRIFHVENLTDLKLPANIDTGRTTGGVGISETALRSVSGFTSTPGGIYLQSNYLLEDAVLDVSETTTLGPNNASLDGVGVVFVSGSAASVNVSLPQLSAIAGGLQVDNCSALSIPALYVVNGDFSMSNASFTTLEAPNLGRINGTLNITGSFTGLLAFPALSRVGGDVYIQSTGNIDCSPFRQLSADAKIGGKLFCQGNVATSSSPSPASASTSASESSSSSLSKGAKAGVGVGVALGVLLILGGAMIFRFRRNRKRRSTNLAMSSTSGPTPGPASGPTEVAASTEKSRVLNEVEGDHPGAKSQNIKSRTKIPELAA